jgi:hypothetical protein
MIKTEKRDFRCNGEKKGHKCNQLLFRYNIDGNELTVVVKCPNCNSFSILKFHFEKDNNNNKKII